MLKREMKVVQENVERGGRVMLVGKKSKDQEIIEDEEKSQEKYYVNERWIGGMMKKWKKI